MAYERCACGKAARYSCPDCNKPVTCSCGCGQTPQNCPNR